MKYIHGKPPQVGDTKIVKKFLWWPHKYINLNTGEIETRWLEYTLIKYEYRKVEFSMEAFEYKSRGWHIVGFYNY